MHSSFAARHSKLNTHPLSTLAQAPAEDVKALAEDVLAHIENHGSVQVLQNRTGIAMLPYTDSVKGTAFHLGEVMMAEAHVRLSPSPARGGGVGEGPKATAHV